MNIHINKCDAIQNEPINMALARAQNLSKRAGIAWALVDGDQELLVCEAIIAGVEKDKLARAISRFKQPIAHLFISIEPTSGVFDITGLIATIELSNCNQITIGCQLPDTCADQHWRDWEKQWQGTVDYLSSNSVAKRLGLGIEKIKNEHRPWVTAVSAANFTGVSLPLQKLINEFGVKNYIIELAQQNRAILYSMSQHEIIENLPDSNLMDEPIELYEIFDSNNIKSILHYCASEYRCSAVIFCDMPLLAHLVSHNLVDEIVHHIANFGDTIATDDEREHQMLTQSFLNLNDWILLSSTVAGNCSRIVLCKQLPTADPAHYLGSGLN